MLGHADFSTTSDVYAHLLPLGEDPGGDRASVAPRGTV
jgi:hypothetical protein